MSTAVQHRLIRQARLLIVTGFAFSFAGTSVVEGWNQGLVALGLLPLIWLPMYSSLQQALDVSSIVVTRALARFRAGSVLVAAEATDLAGCVVALGCFLLLGTEAGIIATIVYLCVLAVVVLVVDVAEEIFVGDLEEIESGQAVVANAYLFSIAPILSLVLGRPLGALLSEGHASVVLGASAVLSIASLAARTGSVRRVRDVLTADRMAESHVPVGTRARLRLSALRRFRGPGSPGLSLAIGALSGATTIYALQAFADTTGATGMGLALASFGLGTAAGPWIVRRLAGRGATAVSWVRAGSGGAVTTLVLLGAALAASAGLGELADGTATPTVAIVVWFAATGTALAVLRTSHITSRQSLYRADIRRELAGWGQTAMAAGALGGAWLGFVALDRFGFIGIAVLGTLLAATALVEVRQAPATEQPSTS